MIKYLRKCGVETRTRARFVSLSFGFGYFCANETRNERTSNAYLVRSLINESGSEKSDKWFIKYENRGMIKYLGNCGVEARTRTRFVSLSAGLCYFCVNETRNKIYKKVMEKKMAWKIET